MDEVTIEDLAFLKKVKKGKKGDRLLFLQERGQSLLLDCTSEKVACPLFYKLMARLLR